MRYLIHRRIYRRKLRGKAGFFLTISAVFALISLIVTGVSSSPLYGATPPQHNNQPYTFIFEGETKFTSTLPEISRTAYISISDLASIYNLSYSFRAISGKAILRAYNRGIEFTLNSDKYTSFSPEGRRRLKSPVRLIKNKLYIPLEFITSVDFSKLTETETLFYPDSRTFIISVKTTVSPARFYSSPDGKTTRILIETTDDAGKNLSPATKFSDGKIILEYQRGKTLDESISVQDSLVKEIRHSNARGGRTAIIEIFLTENARPKPIINIDKETGSAEIIVERGEVAITSISTTSASHDKSPQVSTSTAEITASSYETPSDANFTPAATPSTPPPSPNAFTKYPPASPSLPSGIPASKPQTKGEIATTLSAQPIKIVLDAGHGGEDPGAIGPNGTHEKDINLAIVKELEKLFKEQSSGDDGKKIEVLLTREEDVFVPLVDRTNFANEKSADLFISVHCNASMKRTTGGYEVYFLSENATDPEAIATQILENSVVELEKKSDKKRSKLQELLWSMIVNEFINESAELCHFTTLEIPKRIKVENRGVRQAGFYVLRGAQMPAILVECAFLSNPAEEAKLKNPRIQKQIADGLYTAIKNYLKSKGRI